MRVTSTLCQDQTLIVHTKTSFSKAQENFLIIHLSFAVTFGFNAHDNFLNLRSIFKNIMMVGTTQPHCLKQP